MKDWRIFGVVCVTLALSVWGGFGVTLHLIQAVDAVRDAALGAAQAEARISGPHGTLTMADEDLGAMKSVIVHADLVARHEQQSLTTFDARASQLYSRVLAVANQTDATLASAQDAVGRIGRTADAASSTLAAGTLTLQSFQPVVSHADASLTQFDALYPDISRFAASAAVTSEQAAQISTDTRKVADHVERAIDNPKKKPWYIRILPHAIQDGVQALLERWAVQG